MNFSKPPIVFEAAKLNRNNLPRTDAHLHTSWTDGKGTVTEVYERAVANNLSAILYSEHSRKTSTDWFSDFAAEVRALPHAPCHAYVGTEVKIETVDGEIDTVDEISRHCDFIMASVHRFPSKSGEPIQFKDTDPADAVKMEFDLSMAALDNKRVDILGHMFGMSYARFNSIPEAEKFREVIKRAAKRGIAVEINSHYHPDPLQILDWCAEFEALVTFGSNAHELEEVGEIADMIEGLA